MTKKNHLSENTHFETNRSDSVREFFFKSRMLFEGNSGVLVKLLDYMDKQDWPPEYPIEQLQEKYVFLDLVATQLAFHSPLEAKHILLYGEQESQIQLLVRSISMALNVQQGLGSQPILSCGLSDNFDLFVLEERDWLDPNGKISRQWLRILDGQGGFLNTSSGVRKKGINKPTLFLSNEIPKDLREAGPYQSRFIRFLFYTCVDDLDESRIVATLLGCMIRRIKQAYSNLNPKGSHQLLETSIRLTHECRARFVRLRSASDIELKRPKDENREGYSAEFHRFMFHEWAPYHDRWNEPIAIFGQECFRLPRPHDLASLILTERGQFLDCRLRFIDMDGVLPVDLPNVGFSFYRTGVLGTRPNLFPRLYPNGASDLVSPELGLFYFSRIPLQHEASDPEDLHLLGGIKGSNAYYFDGGWGGRQPTWAFQLLKERPSPLTVFRGPEYPDHFASWPLVGVTNRNGVLLPYCSIFIPEESTLNIESCVSFYPDVSQSEEFCLHLATSAPGPWSEDD